MLNEQYIGQFQKMEVRAPLLQSYPDFTSTRMIKKIESFIYFFNELPQDSEPPDHVLLFT
jgi:hypothetical protein